jgi:hypothetical protein
MGVRPDRLDGLDKINDPLAHATGSFSLRRMIRALSAAPARIFMRTPQQAPPRSSCLSMFKNFFVIVSI